MKHAFLDEKSRNVAPAECRKRPASGRLSRRWPSQEIWSLIPSGLVTVDIEAGSFGSLLKSRRKSDSAGAHCCCRRATYDIGCVKVISRWSNPTNSALGAQLVPEDIAGILARPRSLRECARQFERAIVMTGHCVRCLCQTAPRPRPSRGRSDGKRPGPAMAEVRLFSAGAHAPLHRETK